jgi:uncharacterized membrane protein (DUF2068 family)
MASRRTRKSAGPPQRSLTLFLIALFKLTKGVLLLIVGFGVHRLLHRDVAETVAHWVDILRVDPDNRYIHRLLAHILAVTPAQLRAASVGTFIYAGLLLTEGFGLLLRKRWAEYFTIITTAGLIPLEVYEIVHRVTISKIAIFVINVAIVAYLIARVREPKRGQ